METPSRAIPRGGKKFEVNGIGVSPDGKSLWLGGPGMVWSKTWSADGWAEHRLPSADFPNRAVREFTFCAARECAFVRDTADQIFSSYDDGQTWKQVGRDLISANSLAISRAGRVWIATRDGAIYRGTIRADGWTKVTVGSAGAFRRVIPHPSAPGEFLILSSTGCTFATHGGGRSLSEFRHPIRCVSALDIAARSSDEIWAVGDNGLSTPDPGKRESRVDDSDNLWSIRFFADGNKGLVGGYGTIRGTTDAGKSWQKAFRETVNDPTDNVNEIFLSSDGTRAWGVSSNGHILSSTSVLEEWKTQRWATVPLQSIWFVGGRGWASGGSGLILSSNEWGGDWKPQPNPANQLIYRIRFAKDGQRGWAVGNGGTILTTENGGTKWHAASSGTKVNLRDVIDDINSKRVWAVGWGATFLLSEDGGLTWNRLEGIEGATYRRFPAPWFWLFLAFVVWFTWARAQESTVGQSATIPAIAVSDNPITTASEDRFGFHELAQAISQFVRNINTRPPFIVAVTGQWGSGKSSVMHLLRADLKEAGFRPVWWNAWHYQEESTALTSAMEHIRSQAIPSALSFANLRLRWRLLSKRLLQPVVIPGLVLVALLAATAWMSLVLGHGGIARGLERFKDLGDWQERAAYALALVGVGGAFWLAKLIKPFSSHSKRLAALWGRVSTSAQIRSLPYDAGVRYRFANEFSDLTDALAPSRLVVIVDDLDRCHPDRVVNVLETVNFLVTSGKCIVILGMDLDRVLASVSVAFEKVAKAMPSVEKANSDGADSHNDSPEVAFARSYIRKMINLEVQVPTQGLNIHRLMFGSTNNKLPQQSSHRLRRFEFKVALAKMRSYTFILILSAPKRLRRGLTRWRGSVGGALTQLAAEFATTRVVAPIANILRIVLLLAVGWIAGQQFVLYADEAFPAEQSKRTREAELANEVAPTQHKDSTSSSDASTTVGSIQAIAPDLSKSVSPVVFIPGSTHSPVIFAGALALLSGLGILAIWRTYFSGPVRDSRAFESAMRHWSLEMSRHLVTPREMKRFLNRVRFAALRVRVERRRGMAFEFYARIRRLARAIWALGVKNQTRIEQPPASQVIDEETLVRLAAYQVCGHDINMLVGDPLIEHVGAKQGLAQTHEKLLALDARLAELLFQRRNAIQRAAALRAYEAILGGVRY